MYFLPDASVTVISEGRHDQTGSGPAVDAVINFWVFTFDPQSAETKYHVSERGS